MKITSTRSFYTTSLPKTSQSQQTPSLHKYLTEQQNIQYKSKIIFYKKGEYIYKPGMDFQGIYEVLSGAVRISNISESGEEVTSEVLTHPDLFGNLKASANNSSEFSKALTDSKIKIYNIDFFTELKSKDPRIGSWFSDYVINRWARLEGRLLRINTYKTSNNVAFLYKELNRRIINSNGKEQVLLKLITQKDIADLTGATRQTVSTVIKEIEYRGA